MKYFENIIYDHFTENDIKEFIKAFEEEYTQVKESNFYEENMKSKFDYINLIPKLIFGLNEQVQSSVPIILWMYDNTSIDTYWHIDSSSDKDECQITILAYLQIDENAGGEFLTKQTTTKIKPGSIIVLPSSELHAVNRYKSTLPRISLKWMYNVDKKTSESFKD